MEAVYIVCIVHRILTPAPWRASSAASGTGPCLRNPSGGVPH
eukprot:COSAG02_NODE_43187_length_377_cov_0.820144_2_plen_41_part_01